MIASQRADWREVVGRLPGPLPAGQGDLLPEAHDPPPAAGHGPRLARRRCAHAFLIRDPRECWPRYAQGAAPTPTLADLGLPQQVEIFEQSGTGRRRPCVDAGDVLQRPARRCCAPLCEALGVPFTPAMLSWPAGPRATDGVWAKYWYDARRGDDRLRAATAARPRAAARARSAPLRRGSCRPLLRAAARAPAAPPDARRSCPMLQTFDERNRDLIVNINGRLVHRDEAAVSPFDSVGAGRRRGLGGAAALPRPDLPARASTSTGCAARPLALAFARDPAARGDHRADPPHARAPTSMTRRRAHPADADPRRQGHQRHGPAAQPGRADADRAGRAQAAGLRHRRASRWSPAACGGSPPDVPRPEDPPQQPDPVDPGQDRGQRRRRRRRADARRRAASSPRPTPRTCSSSSAARSRTPRTVACPEGITRAAVLRAVPRRTASRRRCGDLSLTEVYPADEVFCTGTMGELTRCCASTAGPSGTASRAR